MLYFSSFCLKPSLALTSFHSRTYFKTCLLFFPLWGTLKPVHWGFSPHHSTETILGKTTNGLQPDKLRGHRIQWSIHCIDILLNFLQDFKVYNCILKISLFSWRVNPSFLSINSNTVERMSVVREGQAHHLQVGVERRVGKNSETKRNTEMLPSIWVRMCTCCSQSTLVTWFYES